MVDMTREQAQDVIDKLRRARKLVSELAAHGAHNWTMSVPARSDDSDILLAGALDEAINALASQPAPVAEPAQPAAAVPVQALSDDLILQWALAAPTNRVTSYVAHLAYAHGLAQPRAAEPVPTAQQLESANSKGYDEAVDTIMNGYQVLLAAVGLPPDEGDGMDMATAYIMSDVLRQIGEGLAPLKITRDDEHEYRASASPAPKVEDAAQLAYFKDLAQRQRKLESQLQGEVNELEIQLAAKEAEIASERREHRLTKHALELRTLNYKQADKCAHEREIEILRLSRELEQAKAEGRREALREVPLEALRSASMVLQNTWAGNAGTVRRARFIEQIDKLIESARAAQAD